MPYVTGQVTNTGSYVPTTNIWDVSQINAVDVNSPEFKELLVRLYQNVNNIALALNTKDSAFYLLQEFNYGAVYFNPSDPTLNGLRPGYRILINTGALAGGLTTVAHGLTVTNTWTWIKINGAATDSVNLLGYPITYADTGGANISVSVDATNVYINNGSGQVFTNSVVVLEYLKI